MLDGVLVVTYEIGWNDADLAPTEGWMMDHALQGACEEDLRPKERIDDVVVTLGEPRHVP
jgi:hypothetical protein